MKFNFKKIAAIGASALMIGMSMGVAAAANFPAPFSGTAASNVAVVSGTGAGVDDTVATNSMANYLAGKVSGGGTTITGESFKFEKTSTKFHLGDKITEVVSSSLDDTELPTILADGTYTDKDNDEFDYTQKIDMGTNLQLTMFEDSDYKEDEPTVGFKIASGATVLTYTLDFSDEPLLGDMPTTDLTMMGKTYYVLSNSSSGVNKILTLLDSAEDTIISEGETVTIAGKQVSISYISDSEVKFSVDGQTTNSLAEGATQKLSDGSYLGVKDIMYVQKESGISKVEFSLGKGKLKLTSGSDVEINDESISGLEVTLTNSSDGAKLAKIAIAWTADDDLFVTEDNTVTMPAFEAVKLSFGGLSYPAEETLEVKQGGDTYAVLEDFPLKDTTADIAFLYGATAGTFSGIGKSANDLLVTAADGANVTFNKSRSDEYFVASWSDTNDGESYLMKADNFITDGAVYKADIKYLKDGSWATAQSKVKDEDTFSIGNVEIKVYTVNDSANNEYIILGNNSIYTNFNTLYSVEGMKVYLPVASTTNNTVVEGEINFQTNGNTSTGHNGTSFYLVFKEEDKNEKVAGGEWLNVTVAWDSGITPEVEISAVDKSVGATSTEIDDTDVWRDFVYSALATEILFDKPSSGQKSVKLVYHGAEVPADVYISESAASVSGAEAGSMVFTDAEKASWQGRNVVLVGGSCINSATAQALGVAYPTCEAAFTTATGVGSGQYLIKSVGNAFTSGKIALVVAGYSKADTQAAVNRLIQPGSEVDTTAGKAYLGIVGATGTSTLAPM